MSANRIVLTVVAVIGLLLAVGHFTGALVINVKLPGELWGVSSGAAIFIAFLLLSAAVAVGAAVLRLAVRSGRRLLRRS